MLKYNYNYLSFLSDIDIRDGHKSQSLRLININGETTHILTDPHCVIQEMGRTLRLQQSIKSNVIILDFQNETSAIRAHERLRNSLQQLENNLISPAEYNNNARVILMPEIGVQLINGKPDENKINIAIDNIFNDTNYTTKIVENGETIIFKIPIKYYRDTDDENTFEYEHIRIYMFLLGNGEYVKGNITHDALELINMDGNLDVLALKGFKTEYVIDLIDNESIKMRMTNSKMEIINIESVDGSVIDNLMINGTPISDSNTLPIELLPYSELVFESTTPCIFNIIIIKYML